MNFGDEMKLVTTDFDNLSTTKINVIDNDLSYITSVLEKIDYVISKTYGPFSGYVAFEDVSQGGASSFSYSKDGLTTLGKLNFMNPTDQGIANMVEALTDDIKNKSGDGSTTAAKLIYNIVKYAAQAIKDNVEDIYKIRINTPKVIDRIFDKINEKIEEKAIKVVTYQNLLDIAYIALNNDEFLLRPIKELVNYLEDNNIPINGDLNILTTLSTSEETKISKSLGYLLSVTDFKINPNIKELENVKFIMLPNALDLTYLHVVWELHKFAQANAFKDEEGIPLKIIFIVSELDDNLKLYLQHGITQDFPELDDKLNYDFIELDYIYHETKYKREDLCALLNINEILLNDYLEKRTSWPPVDMDGNPYGGDDYDRPNNTNFIKFIAPYDENTRMRDHVKYRQKFHKVLSQQIANGLFANISYREASGLTVSLVPGQPTPEKYNNHIKELKEVAKLENTDAAEMARVRLSRLRDDCYLVEIGNRVGDTSRLLTAYRDAVKAMISSAKYGYHMGGSIGVYVAVMKTLKEFREEDQSSILNKTADFITTILKDSFTSIIRYLLPNRDVAKSFLNRYINTQDMTFGDTVVISPIETDTVMIKNVLLVFSNLFSSLALEYQDFSSVLHILNIEDQIKEKLGFHKKEEVKVIENNITYKTPEIKEEPEIKPIEESEEDRKAREEFEAFKRSLEEDSVIPLITGLADNVQPLNDPLFEKLTARKKKDIIEPVNEIKVSNNLVIEGYDGPLNELNSLVKETIKQEEERKNNTVDKMRQYFQ